MEETKISKHKQLELTYVFGMNELFSDFKPTLLEIFFSCWKTHRLFFGLEHNFWLLKLQSGKDIGVKICA